MIKFGLRHPRQKERKGDAPKIMIFFVTIFLQYISQRHRDNANKMRVWEIVATVRETAERKENVVDAKKLSKTVSNKNLWVYITLSPTEAFFR